MHHYPILNYLRFAVTALSLTACVLLIALWVRSYWWSDMVSYRPDKVTMYRVYSHDGLVIFRETSIRLLTMHEPPDIGWALHTNWSPNQSRDLADAPLIKRIFRGSHWHLPLDWYVPYWLPVIFAGALAAAPWSLNLGMRFSLRTMLIATTLVAVGLGIIVAAL